MPVSLCRAVESCHGVACKADLGPVAPILILVVIVVVIVVVVVLVLILATLVVGYSPLQGRLRVSHVSPLPGETLRLWESVSIIVTITVTSSASAVRAPGNSLVVLVLVLLWTAAAWGCGTRVALASRYPH